MIDQKIKNAVKCLYACAVVQIVMAVYVAFKTFSSVQQLRSAYPSSANEFMRENPYIYFSGVNIFSVGLIVGAVLVAKELREQKVWAWFAAMIIFLFSAASWALPFALIGLLMILDARVREEFTAKIDVSL